MSKKHETQEELKALSLEELRELTAEKYKEMIQLLNNQPDNKRNTIITLLSATLQELQENNKEKTMSIKWVETKEELEALDLEVPNVDLDKWKALESLEGEREEFEKVIEAIENFNKVSIDGEALQYLKENFIDIYGVD